MTEPYIEVLLEGAADVPMVRHVLTSRLGLEERRHFRIHPHHGKGRLPTNPLSMPDAFVGIDGVVGKTKVDQNLGLLRIGFGGLEIQQERVNARLSSFLREGRLSNHAEDASQE